MEADVGRTSDRNQKIEHCPTRVLNCVYFNAYRSKGNDGVEGKVAGLQTEAMYSEERLLIGKNCSQQGELQRKSRTKLTSVNIGLRLLYLNAHRIWNKVVN